MRLKHGIHLGYCTNIHRGETWGETFAALRTHTDAVRRRVSPDQPYGIGLRLGAAAAVEGAGYVWYNSRAPARVGLAAPVAKLIRAIAVPPPGGAPLEEP